MAPAKRCCVYGADFVSLQYIIILNTNRSKVAPQKLEDAGSTPGHGGPMGGEQRGAG